MPDKRDIGAAIIALRSIHQMTQKDLAEAAGINNSRVSRYENAVEMPNAQTLDSLMAALCVSPPEFYRFLAQVQVIARRRSAGWQPDQDGSYASWADVDLVSDLSSPVLDPPTGDLDGEAERLATEIGRTVSRMVRLHYRMLRDEAAAPDGLPDDPGMAARPGAADPGPAAG